MNAHTSTETTPSTFGNASYGPYRVAVLGDHTHADPRHVVWVDYVFENGRGGTAPIATIKFDNPAPTEEEHHCICDHCRDAGTCFGCTSGHCP